MRGVIFKGTPIGITAHGGGRMWVLYGVGPKSYTQVSVEEGRRVEWSFGGRGMDQN